MKKLIIFSWTCLLLATGTAQSVFVDPTFNAQDPGFNYGGAFDQAVSDVIELPDGKLLVCGWFTEYNGIPCSRIARLLPDGEIDPTFDVGVGPDGAIRDMVVQPDGKVLVSGYFFNFSGQQRWGMARLHADGALDEGFDQGTVPGQVFYGQPEALALQADGKVLLGGYHFCGTGLIQNCLKRFNTDGTIDASFNASGAGICVNNEVVSSIIVRPDNKILIAGTFAHYNGQSVSNMALLNSDGSLDNSFSTSIFNGSVRIAAFFPDGDMLINGSFTTVNGIDHPYIAKLSPAGILDPGFHPSFTHLGVVSYAICAAVRSDGRVVVGGHFDACNGTEHDGIVRLMPDGAVDPSFSTEWSLFGDITSITELNDGRLILGGQLNGYELSCMYGLSCAHPDGALDLSFNPGWGVNNEVRALAVQPDGKLIISGPFSRVNTTWTPGIARINTDGTWDPTFDAGDGLFSSALDIKIRPDGRILLSGAQQYDGHVTSDVIQLEADGTMDPTFDPQCGGYSGVYDMALLADGKVLVCGNFQTIDGITRRAVARLDQEGNVDAGFDPGIGSPGCLIRSMSVANDGRIVLGGTFDDWNDQPVGRIIRLLANGDADPAFNTGSGFDDMVHGVLVQPDGRVVATGSFASFNGIARNGIARLNVDGSLDTSFDPGTGLDGAWSTLLHDMDGNVIVAGAFPTVDGQPMSNIARLTTTGGSDPNFTIGSGFTRNGHAIIPAVKDMAVLPNGQLIAAGAFTGFNGVGRNRLLRLFAPTSVGVSEVQTTTDIALWPNPCTSSGLSVSAPGLLHGTVVRFTVADASGRIVWQHSATGAGPWDLPLDGSLATGSYQLVLRADDEMARTTFVVQP